MQVIDAHLHLFAPGPESDAMAQAVGHENTTAYLAQYYAAHGISHGIVMTNQTLHPSFPSFLHYCLGLDQHRIDENTLSCVEENLKSEQCVGIKLYPGYNRILVTDPCFDPIYALAAKYHKPVAIHTGMTAHARALLRYCHPLTLDDAAAAHPDVTFIMCHFGNPFLAEAAAVLEKNPNVYADLSGLLAGRQDLTAYYHRQTGYLSILKSWIAYVDDYRRFLFGTDFPAVNIEEYISFIKHLIPAKHYHTVFFENANQVYQLGLE